MKKVMYVALTIAALVLGAALVAYAADGPRGPAGFQGHAPAGFQGRAEVPAHRGFFEHHEVHPHPGIPHRPGFADHHDFRHHHGTRVFVAPGFWWAPDWWGPDYPPYAPPPVYGQPETQPQYYWYYCQNPQGYYPYVQQCPGGWQTVVPSPPPAG